MCDGESESAMRDVGNLFVTITQSGVTIVANIALQAHIERIACFSSRRLNEYCSSIATKET